jgi:GH15 family glucan-1,4-alpha-glucosidase
MCWVALHRACDLAVSHGHHRHLARWSRMRDRIWADVLEHGYSNELRSITQSYGDTVLDAANLRLPLVGFLPADEPRMRSTIDVTGQGLAGPDGILYRYRPAGGGSLSGPSPVGGLADDGLPGSEGAFLACTFWLISDLCHLGRLEEARDHFERMLTFASPLGLYSEEADLASGEMLGNYPQAFTHIGLINSAVTIERAVEGRLGPQAWPAQQGQ